jgi:hypothetical protein
MVAALPVLWMPYKMDWWGVRGETAQDLRLEFCYGRQFIELNGRRAFCYLRQRKEINYRIRGLMT